MSPLRDKLRNSDDSDAIGDILSKASARKYSGIKARGHVETVSCMYSAAVAVLPAVPSDE